MYQLGTSLNTNGQSHNIYGTRLDSLAQESPFPEFLFRTLGNLTAGWKMKQTVSKIYPGCVCESNEVTSLWWTPSANRINTAKVKLSKPPITHTVTKDIYKRMSDREQPQILEDSSFLLATDQGNWDSPTQIRVHKPAVDFVTTTTKSAALFPFSRKLTVARGKNFRLSGLQGCWSVSQLPQGERRGTDRPVAGRATIQTCGPFTITS